jgi:hypothetical protein
LSKKQDDSIFEPPNMEKSDFDFDNEEKIDFTTNHLDLIDFGETNDEKSEIQDKYRTSYRFESSSVKDTESDFFKHLESKRKLF